MLVGVGAITDADWALIEEGRGLLPSCYGPEISGCLDDRNLAAYPNCERLHQLFDTNDVVDASLEGYVEGMPYCEDLKSGEGRAVASAPSAWLFGLVTSLVAGVVVGLVMKGRF
jgi:hypothetical protein